MRIAALVLVLFLSGGGFDLPVAPPPPPKIETADDQRKRNEDPPLPPPPPEPEDPPDVPPPVIFGEALEGVTSLVYVVDMSGSMSAEMLSPFVDLTGRSVTGTRLKFAQTEVIKSLRGLDPSYSYDVEFFECQQIFAHSQARGMLLPATPGQVRRDERWVQERAAWGGTGTGSAVVRALLLEPDAVVLITDGHPGCEIREDNFDVHLMQITSFNKRPIPIHVWGVALTTRTRQWCQRVASFSGGQFREIH